jgi:hypothetical protein
VQLKHPTAFEWATAPFVDFVVTYLTSEAWTMDQRRRPEQFIIRVGGHCVTDAGADTVVVAAAVAAAVAVVVAAVAPVAVAYASVVVCNCHVFVCAVIDWYFVCCSLMSPLAPMCLLPSLPPSSLPPGPPLLEEVCGAKRVLLRVHTAGAGGLAMHGPPVAS